MLKEIPVLEALANLRNNQDFNTVVSWLERRKQESWSMAIYSEGEHSAVLRGKAQECASLLEDIVKAPDTLKAMRGRS